MRARLQVRASVRVAGDFYLLAENAVIGKAKCSRSAWLRSDKLCTEAVERDKRELIERALGVCVQDRNAVVIGNCL